MEKYLYTAYDTAGARHQDQVDAINRESATQKLKEMDLIPVSIERMDTNRKFKELPIFQQKPGILKKN